MEGNKREKWKPYAETHSHPREVLMTWTNCNTGWDGIKEVTVTSFSTGLDLKNERGRVSNDPLAQTSS